MGLEAGVEGPCVHLAKQDGWWTKKVKWIGNDGAPDRIFAKAGRTLWIEFKRPDRPHRQRLQAIEQEEMRQAGMEVYRVDSIAQFRKLLEIP